MRISNSEVSMMAAHSTSEVNSVEERLTMWIGDRAITKAQILNRTIANQPSGRGISPGGVIATGAQIIATAFGLRPARQTEQTIIVEIDGEVVGKAAASNMPQTLRVRGAAA